MRLTSVLFGIFVLVLSIDCAYSPKVALELAYMSSIAYEPLASINSWSCSKCKTYPLLHVKGFSNGVGDLQGFTGYSANLKGIILSFRGSSNIQNWIINLSTNQIAYSKCAGCKVHNGFYTAWGLAKSLVYSQIQSLRSIYRNATIYVTGHSLGGALATLAVPDLKELYGSIHSLITFGEPRVGNPSFSQYYSSVIQSLRVVHYADMVPHNPPASFGFLHQGHEVWYDKSMKTYKVCEVGESALCSNSLSVTSYNAGDHSMDTYYLTLPVSTIDYLLKVIQQNVQMFKKIMMVFLGKELQQFSDQNQLTVSDQ